MKSGIIGLPGAGKSTIFQALTKNFVVEMKHKEENRIGTIHVPDRRVDVLSDMYKPKKTIFAQVEYLLPGSQGAKRDKAGDQSVWLQVRDCDALIHVIRNFVTYGFEAPKPYEDFLALDQELIFADLVVVEKRLERLGLDKKR